MVPAAKSEVQHELGIPLNRHETVSITNALVFLFGRPLVGYLLFDEGPDFITLHVLKRNVADQSAHELFASVARQYKAPSPSIFQSQESAWYNSPERALDPPEGIRK